MKYHIGLSVESVSTSMLRCVPIKSIYHSIFAFSTLINEENKILDTLSTDDNLLENDAAVQLISTSKIQINELLEKISVSKVTEKQIDVTRTAYKPLAAHAAVIYFTIGKAHSSSNV